MERDVRVAGEGGATLEMIDGVDVARTTTGRLKRRVVEPDRVASGVPPPEPVARQRVGRRRGEVTALVGSL